MSEENVEVVLAAVEAVNRGDPDAFVACLHPDVVWEESGDVFPGLRGTYDGPARVREWFEGAFLGGIWEGLHIEVEEITEVGDDRVFLETLLTARGAGSGVETKLSAWQVLWFADGCVTRRQVFFKRDEALEAAGLSD
jgi:ketosteroid isomerase-like protein